MIQIRKNVFETNSSSTHSLVITTESEYEKFDKGELVYCEWSQGPFKSGKFYPKTDVDKYAEEMGDDFEESDFKTAKDFFENEYLEFFEEHYTTEHGDNIVVFGVYGYGG